MLGPDLSGMGGISRVVKNWESGGIFKDKNILYIASVKEHCSSKLIFMCTAIIQFCLACYKYKPRIIYIHTSSYNSFYRKSIFICIAIIFKIKIILHIHPSHFYQFLQTLKYPKKSLVFLILKKIDLFIVLTRCMKVKIQSLFPNKLIHVIPNPVIVPRLNQKNFASRKKCNFLYLGWFVESKGIYDLVDAAKLLTLKNEKFTVDFYGTKEIAKLVKYIQINSLQNYCIVHGWANDETKFEALHSCTALILPSHTEGIPNVILEAMACKTPIISTLVGGLTEILRESENAFIVEPKNCIDLAEKMAIVLHNKNLSQKLADQAYMDVLKNFDISIVANKLKSII